MAVGSTRSGFDRCRGGPSEFFISTGGARRYGPPNTDEGSAVSGWQDDIELHAIGDGRYGATITAAWNIGTFPDGGFLMATAMRAAGERSPLPDPVAATTTFLRPVEPGPVMIEIEVVRHGRTVTVLGARMFQGSTERNRTIATFAELPPPDADAQVGARRLQTVAPPDLPDPDECEPALYEPAPGFELEITRTVEMRFVPGTSILAGAPAAERTSVEAWLRFPNGAAPDVYTPPLAVDAFLPVPIEAGILTWSPTLELSVYLRARPAPGWLRVRRRTTLLADGMFEEDGEVWDSADRLVAQSRQLSRLGTIRPAHAGTNA